MTDTEDAHQLEGKLSVKANADRIEGGGGLRPRPRCRSGSNSVRRETPHSPSMRQEHEALKKAFEYLESELQDTADEEPPPPTTQTTTTTQQPESQQAATPTQVAWAEQLDDKLRSLARRSQEPGASTAKIEDDGDEGIYEYENGNEGATGKEGDGEGEGDEGGGGDAEGDADSEDWSESTEVELPSARVLCGRCWRRDEPVAADDCVFIHPSGDVYHHEEPNLPVLPFTIGHLNKVSEADCKWFHAQESGNGCGGANVVLKWLNWPWPFSLCPDFVQVAIELLDYCLKAADPGGCGNGSDVGAKLRSDSVTSQCWLYGKKKEKEEDKWFSVIVLSLDEAWTKIRHDPNLKTQLPKLTLTFLNFLFNSDWKLSEAVVTLKKVLDDESSKEIDKEQFAVMFCQKLDRWVECYTETQSKLEEDNLLGVIRLMTKLACIFSSEIAEKHFLPRYISFTTHKTYEVRRLCVYKIHEMAYAISESAVETQLLPAFLRLCHDKDSKVRAPCLLGIVALSSKLPMKLRITVLAPVYYRLLDRQNALDNMNLFAAYFPTFCPFITTLAHTPIASLELNQNCDVVLSYLNNSEFGFEMNFSLTSYNKGGIWRFHENNTSCFSTKDSDESPPSKNIEDPFGFNELIQHEEEFKSFQYWREPIDDCFVHPEVIDIMKDKWADNVGSMEDFWNRLNSEETRKSIAKKPLKSASISVGSPLEIYDEEKSKELSMLVSSKLVKAYLPQQRLRWAMNTTACDSLAIYLPPVAFTIGPKNWHLLKSAFNLLAAHEDWKIRAAISTIIHELALMLSKEQTEEDLLPVFKSIMEDLEPVRIGTLSHMASFLGSLNSSARMTFLTRFPDFLCPDFRLREVLVDQLVPVVSLFSACDILTFILPVVILVLQDKIAAVRQKAINLACELSMQVLSYDSKLCGNVLKKFVEHLAMSTEWRHRQTFANLAAPLCINRAAGMNSLSSTVFPQLFNLCNDKVVNVRIATARTLRDINNTSDLRDVVPTREIRRSLRLLAQVDEDPDVRELSLFDWS